MVRVAKKPLLHALPSPGACLCIMSRTSILEDRCLPGLISSCTPGEWGHSYAENSLSGMSQQISATPDHHPSDSPHLRHAALLLSTGIIIVIAASHFPLALASPPSTSHLPIRRSIPLSCRRVTGVTPLRGGERMRWDLFRHLLNRYDCDHNSVLSPKGGYPITPSHAQAGRPRPAVRGWPCHFRPPPRAPTKSSIAAVPIGTVRII